MVSAENAVRSVFSTILLLVGVLILIFGIFIAFEAQAITFSAVVYFLIGAVIIAISSWI